MDIPQALSEAEQAIAVGDNPRAQEILYRLIAIDPQNVQACLLLARAADSPEERDEYFIRAKRLGSDVLDNIPEPQLTVAVIPVSQKLEVPATGLLLEARQAIHDEEFERAEEILDGLVTFDPHNQQAWLLLASLEHSPAKKKEYLDKAQALDSDNIAPQPKIEGMDRSIPETTKPEEPVPPVVSVAAPASEEVVDISTLVPPEIPHADSHNDALADDVPPVLTNQSVGMSRSRPNVGGLFPRSVASLANLAQNEALANSISIYCFIYLGASLLICFLDLNGQVELSSKNVYLLALMPGLLITTGYLLWKLFVMHNANWKYDMVGLAASLALIAYLFFHFPFEIVFVIIFVMFLLLFGKLQTGSRSRNRRW